jgi:hypothetical protein
MKKSNSRIVSLTLAFIIAAVLTFFLNKDFFQPKPDMTAQGYVQVSARITEVSPPGLWETRNTLLTVDYEYEGQGYSATLSIRGYIRGRYNIDDKITCWLNPAFPKTLIF